MPQNHTLKGLEGLGQHLHSALGGVVGDVAITAVGHGADAADGADVDNLAVAGAGSGLAGVKVEGSATVPSSVLCSFIQFRSTCR